MSHSVGVYDNPLRSPLKLLFRVPEARYPLNIQLSAVRINGDHVFKVKTAGFYCSFAIDSRAIPITGIALN
jgi:hypothetical protein